MRNRPACECDDTSVIGPCQLEANPLDRALSLTGAPHPAAAHRR
jgi:hypothetical protein